MGAAAAKEQAAAREATFAKAQHPVKGVASPVKVAAVAPVVKSIDDWASDQSQFAGLPPLPSGWIRALSKGDQSLYYINVATGETQVDMPDATLPDGWITKQSRSTGSVYYFNKLTGETEVTKPIA